MRGWLVIGLVGGEVAVDLQCVVAWDCQTNNTIPQGSLSLKASSAGLIWVAL